MKRPLVIVALAMTISLVVALLLPRDSYNVLIIAGIIFVVLSIIVYRTLPKKQLKIQIWIVFLLSTGFTWIFFFLYTQRVVTPVVNLDQENHRITAVVEEQVGISYGESTIYNVTVVGMDREFNRDFKARITTPTDLRVGSYFVAEVLFFLPERQPYFDTRGYIASQGVFIQGEVDSNEFYILSVPEKEPFRYQVRNWLLRSFRMFLEDDAAGLSAAMLIGDKSGIDSSYNTALSASGMSHLVAISGTQFSVLILVFALLLQKFGATQKKVAIFAILIAFGYFFLIGENPAVFRAAIATFVTYIGVLLDRKTDAFTTLSICAVVQYLFNPYVLLNASFTLSYMAVLSILLIFPRLQKMAKRKKPNYFNQKWKSTVWNSLILSVSVSIGLLPLSIFYFRRISLFSPITTLIGEPISIFIMLSSILLCIFQVVSFLEPVCLLLAKMIKVAVWLFYEIAITFSKLPFSSFYLWGSYIIIIALISIVSFFLVLYYKKRLKNILPITLILLLLTISIHQWGRYQNIEVLYLSVNSSESYMIFSHNEAIIYLETARPGDGKRILEHMEQRGITKISYLVILDEQYGTRNSAQDLLNMQIPTFVICPSTMLIEGIETIPLGNYKWVENDRTILLQDGNFYIKTNQFEIGIVKEDFTSTDGFVMAFINSEWHLFYKNDDLGILKENEYGSIQITGDQLKIE